MPKPDRPESVMKQLIPHLVTADVHFQECPAWLIRPGRAECRDLWPTVQHIYNHLTEQHLPETMPQRELRRIDITLHYPDGSKQFLEIDETQHFNQWRSMTLDFYPDDVPVGFPKDQWKDRSDKSLKLPGGGFARPKPPLFPEQGGRHRQRAFRDMLADLLPSQYDYRPTLRVSDLEVAEWQSLPNPLQGISRALIDRGLPAEYISLATT
jgi:hypothetical protein